MDDQREQRKAFLVPLLLALAGAVVLAWAMPRYNAGVGWNYQLDRPQAIARAHAEAARLGLDTRNWLPRLKATANPTTAYYLSLSTRRAETSLLSPVTTTVMLVEPAQRKQSYSVDLNTGGQVIAYEIRDGATASPSPTPEAQETKETVPVEASRRRAQGALEGLVGVEAAREFSLVSEVGAAQGTRFTWERAIAQEDRLKLRVESLVRGESVRRIEHSSSFAPRFVDEYRSRLSTYRLTELLSVLYAILLALMTLGFCLLGWMRREFNFRTTFVLLVAVYLLGLVWRIYGGGFEQLLMTLNAEGNDGLPILGFAINLLTLPFFYALAIALVWGAGRIYARRTRTPQIASFESLLRGRLTSRLVARAVALGILLGVFLCAIPYLLAASGLFGRLQLDGALLGSLASSSPALVALIRPIDYGLFVLYGFLLPLVVFYTRAPRIARVFGLVIACVWILNEDIYRTSASAAWVTAALVVLTLDQIIRRFDLLTLLVALLASDAVRAAWSLVVQPSPLLRGSGYRALAGVAVVLGGALVLSWKGQASEASEASEDAGSNQALEGAERDRLRAEFNVAHEAQQRMLPSNPPRVTGYEISAMCRPAREVGGDLFDFLTLPNERIGFVVADVSGKGVPAALYMTLTKGLLASVAESESDPARILREVNRHLYEVCRRKVFVTMILGVLDAPTRTLTYARAGHNPGVWRSARTRSATWLRARGLGLGLNKGALFDKSLQLESIKFESGDALLFYSDGITEAMNARGEEYGEERLLAAVAATDGLSAERMQNAIVEDVVEFLDGVAPQDDMTLVVVRVGDD